VSTQELSLNDNHPADLGSETFEREKDLGLHRLVKQQVLEVDLALHRLEQGSYGRCEGCGGPIPDARLEVIPEARRCISCQSSARPPLRHRPVEEEVLSSGELTTGVDPDDVDFPRSRS
jgi:phage/conjugal plasmid C-4 type zinc finger TraR family protein